MMHRFHPAADWELIDAARFYESSQRGLGSDFLDELEAVELGCGRTPSSLSSGRRRASGSVATFPLRHSVSIEPDEILIVAVMHLHRRPSYRIHRVR